MSIPLPPPSFRLPDFRNLGIWLRVLLLANGLMLVLGLTRSPDPARWPEDVSTLAASVEPALLLTMAGLFVLSPALQRLPALPGAVVVVMLSALAMAGVDAYIARFLGGTRDWRGPFAFGTFSALLLAWLDLRARAQAPALAEARLSALTARIRPHFFFNSLNAVLGIIREDPRRAETVLEELAELFRALMRDNRDLTPLSEEISLARKYLDIERLRLGDRLQVHWEVADCPAELLAPPLLLQPLLENAIYHGIEPVAEPGEIRVRIVANREQVSIEIDNPSLSGTTQRRGNHMAIDNLRERLMLFYDLEASLAIQATAGRHVVRVTLPRRSAT